MNAFYVIVGLFICYTQAYSHVLSNNSGKYEIRNEKFTETKSYIIEPNVQVNFFGAMEYCTFNGWRLATIDTVEENTNLVEQLKQMYGLVQVDFWTSGNRLANEISWYWMSTGKPITTFNWADGQPDNAGNNELCLEVGINLSSSGSGTWNDKSCTEKTSSIVCEKNN